MVDIPGRRLSGHIRMANEDLGKLKIDKSEAVIRPRKKKNAFRLVVAALVAAAVVVLYFTGVFTPSVSIETAGVSLVYPYQGFTLLNASGYVVAQRKAAVASKVTGRLVSLSVEEGSRVKKGEVIARLESEDVTAFRNQAEANLKSSFHALDEAEAELKDARLSFEREKELLSKGYIAKADYDSAEARYKKAVAAVDVDRAMIRANEAALSAADVQIGYTLVRAPFDAVVLTKNADIGDIVTPIGAAQNVQAAVVTIADMNSLQVEADVSESNLHQVKVGQPCEIQLDAFPDSRFRGEVHMIVPTADRTKATVMVKVKFLDRDSRILPEMSAKVAFLSRPVTPAEEKPHTAVMSAAIRERKGKRFVFLVKGDRVVETPVELGEKFGDMTEVIQGLTPGEKVAVKPLDKLKDGSRIKLAE
jgi:RND family efflux transporter MFP subunit